MTTLPLPAALAALTNRGHSIELAPANPDGLYEAVIRDVSTRYAWIGRSEHSAVEAFERAIVKYGDGASTEEPT